MFLRNLFCSSEHEEMECDEILKSLSHRVKSFQDKINFLAPELEDSHIKIRVFYRIFEVIEKHRVILMERDLIFDIVDKVKSDLDASKESTNISHGIKFTLYAKKIENDTPSQGPTKYIFYSEKSLEEAKLSFGKICQLINGNETVVKGFTEQNIEQIKKLHPTWFVLGLNKEQDKWSVVLGIDTI